MTTLWIPTCRWKSYVWLNYILPGDAPLTIPKVYFKSEHSQAAAAIFAKQGLTQDDIVMIVSPVSKVVSRTWKAPNFARICDFVLRNYPVKILFTWGPGEKHMVDEVRRLMQEPSPDTDYVIPSLHVLAAIYDKAQLWLGNDSGPRHLAIGVGLPTFGIFGHFWWKHWTPPNSALHACVVPENRDPNCIGVRIDSIDYEKAELACQAWLDRVLPEVTS